GAPGVAAQRIRTDREGGRVNMALDHQRIQNFSDALDAARLALRAGGFNANDEALVNALASVLSADGPQSTAAHSLNYLRLHLAGSGSDECSTLLEMAGEDTRSDADTIEGSTAK